MRRFDSSRGHIQSDRTQTGRAAIGLKVDGGRLFVVGGATGSEFIYHARSRALLRTYSLSTGGSFINDVVVTKRAVVIDSQTPSSTACCSAQAVVQGHRRPSRRRASKEKGGYQHVAGRFSLNGIAAAANGKTLVVVQSVTGRLFTVAPTGVTRAIALAGKILLAPNQRCGRVLTRIERLDVPPRSRGRNRLYAVNARFGTRPRATTGSPSSRSIS